jgi:hypothetical protein
MQSKIYFSMLFFFEGDNGGKKQLWFNVFTVLDCLELKFLSAISQLVSWIRWKVYVKQI